MKTKDIIVFSLTLLLLSSIAIGQTPEDRIKELGITLTEPSQPVANYVKWRKVDNLLYLAGAGADVYGKLGQDLSIEQGYEAARLTAIEIMGTIKAACGDLSKVKQFVKVRGMVNSAPNFYDQPKVINGFSDLIVEVFGEKGKHARAAVGQVALPFNMAVEIEVIVELEN
jgi:enamine deaminase RidA (YjgF/YER057c/UK114 family)